MKAKRLVSTLIIVSVVVAALAIASKHGNKKIETPVGILKGTALGTVYQVSVKGENTDQLRESLEKLFEQANRSMSVFDTTSLLSRINRNQTDTADSNIVYCLRMAEKVSRQTGGKYDVTVQPLVEELGFSGKRAEQRVNIDSLLEFVGYQKLQIDGNRVIKADPRMQIGLNSIAKGAVVDMAARLLEQLGYSDYLVDIGGEIFCRGTNGSGKEWVVGIETPFEGNYSLSGEYISSTIHLTDLGLATSGNYRNYRTDSLGNKFTHIIDPLTGQNTASNLLSATVIAENCALADAYGTALVALGLERSRKLIDSLGLASLLIYADQKGEMQTEVSEQMKQHFK